MDYKHLSFDLWNTLISGNPEYVAHRLSIIEKHWGVSSETATITFRQVKAVLDCLAEQEGYGINPWTTTKALNALMPSKLSLEGLQAYHKEQIQNFYDHPPLLKTDIVDLICALSEKYTLNLLSNTVFASGETLRKTALQEILPFLNFTLFSDEQGMSKPHPEFFRKMIHQVRRLHPDIKRAEILHIGDNKLADGIATSHGLDYLHVENPKDTLAKLAKFL